MVRFLGQSGHRSRITKFPFMTQSGHAAHLIDINARVNAQSSIFYMQRLAGHFEAETQRATSPFWTKAPLVALLIISIGPEIADIVYSRPFIWPGTIFLLVFIVFLALLNWPFLLLYFVCRREVKKEWPKVRSVQLAMWTSLVAMCFASVGMLFLTATEMGGTIDSVVIRLFVEFSEELVPHVLLFTSVPILGLVGWFAGRFIAWLTKSNEVAPEPTR